MYATLCTKEDFLNPADQALLLLSHWDPGQCKAVFPGGSYNCFSLLLFEANKGF